MATRYGWPVALTLVAGALISVPAAPRAARQIAQPRSSERDFDIRDARPAASPRVQTADRVAGTGPHRARVNRESGTLRTLETPDLSLRPNGSGRSYAAGLGSLAPRLGLKPADIASLELVRDYTSRSTGTRHLLFRQVVDGYPVFDSTIGLHLLPNGTVLRVTSNAAPIEPRNASPSLTGRSAALEAERHVPGTASTPSLTWLPVDGALRLAWHALVSDAPNDLRDVLIDAHTGELLIRRSRSRDALAIGRILQSSATAAATPRQPDAMPLGADGTACPPAANYDLRSLGAPFRDPDTAVADTGRLEGNNARVFRGAGGQAATGTPTVDGWVFDFPFNSAASAETFLFFASNFVHDFFYDLGFDEAAGNFQQDNFGRGGTGGDPLGVNARASGRNNANYVHAPEGSSPTINMFLWDGDGCWASDLDGDLTVDLDGDYDLDVFVHEFHHGVSLRLNTVFTGDEAGAMGEGGGDFFAYSVNGNPTLAEYARPGGLRSVNAKGYGDWTCLLGFFCEVHDNGEIWANVLWDVRERFRTDNVGGSATAAINEAHQLYIDALTLSPPAPTMLDMRDAMLLADDARNTALPSSTNFCRLWESFAGRGMGVSALDTADNGLNQVTPAYDVPNGCVPPPGPPVVTMVATTPSAAEAQAVPGAVTVRRDTVSARALTVSFWVGGSAAAGTDYLAVPQSVTIPPGGAEATITIVPIDDALVENNETVAFTLRAGAGYTIGSPSFASVAIVSDDVAADLTVTALTAPQKAAAGSSISVTDTTKNQGSGPSPRSSTRFYLSRDALLDAADAPLEARAIDELPVGMSSTGTTTVVLPANLSAGSYFLFAKADAQDEVVELSNFNNIRAVIVAIGPDLIVSALTVPATAVPGGSVTVSDTTANQGAGPAPASSTRFYLSTNATFEAGDTPLQARGVGALAAGASSTAASTLTLPAAIPTGTYYLLAQADGDTAISELNEVNNTRAGIVRIGPDLTISTFTAPPRGAAGGAFTVTDTVRNTGSGAAGASVTAFYLSSDLAVDAADPRLTQTRAVPALGANETSAGPTTVTLPNVAPGTWFLLANADDTAAVPETLENNNVRFATVLIGPDLTFQTVNAPTTATATATIPVSTVVRNSGAAAAGASVVRFYLSTNTSVDAGDVLLAATQAVPALAPDGTASATTQVVLPDLTGNFYLLMLVDAAQAVPEASELNNVAARVLQLTGR
jgi:subtilase family serine protease